jgi:hypothetical protein
MSSKDGFDVSWFYDAEQREHSSTKDFSAAEIARRPWKALWPPRSEDIFNIWLRCEFPEVLSWRFDPDQPFDQPWRYWLRSLLMRQEENLLQESSRKDGNQSMLLQIQIIYRALWNFFKSNKSLSYCVV